MPAIAPFGAWPSPISARSVARGSRRIDDLAAAPGGGVCWLERRPAEGGRNVLVARRRDGSLETLTPSGFDVRSRVHEYGGGAFCLLPASFDRGGGPEPAVDGSTLDRSAGAPAHAFVNFSDQRVYLKLANVDAPVPLTPADGARYADLVFDQRRRRLLAVQDRPHPGGREETAAIAAIPLPAAGATCESEPQPTVLASGADFYSSPRLSPCGRRLAWLGWNHPNMPWDATALWLADLDERGFPTAVRLVAGRDEARPEAVQQPSFDARGRLVLISDRSGWWNLYRLEEGGRSSPDPPDRGAPHQP